MEYDYVVIRPWEMFFLVRIIYKDRVFANPFSLGFTKTFLLEKKGICMAVFKFVISDGKRSWQVEKDQKDAPVLGKRLGDAFDGHFLGLDGYELQVTGGSDKDGFPMRKDIEGQMRRRFLIKKGVGFSGKKKEKKGNYRIAGMKRRKMLRGDVIGDDISQINCKVVKAGSTPLDQVFGPKAIDSLHGWDHHWVHH